MGEISKADFKYSDEEMDALIQKYCNDFTANAAAGMYDPIHGRDVEIDQVILILLQKGRKNAMLQAPAGVGKTALCVGLAQQIVADNVPDKLKKCRLLEIDLAAMSAGTSSISEFQGRIVPLLKAMAERHYHPDYGLTILFIDEIHQIMPTCHGSAYKGLSEVMKPYLTSGALYVIGATTKDEFRMYIGVDPAMERRFQQVNLSVPDAEGAFMILQAVRPGYIKHHGIDIPDDKCREIVRLTEKYMKKRNQPDKSIMTMDAACAYHVKEFGTGGELSEEAIYTMVSKDIGISALALKE
jgi:ATP-dependent Clp protease ATP-binding subunit ClpA